MYGPKERQTNGADEIIKGEREAGAEEEENEPERCQNAGQRLMLAADKQRHQQQQRQELQRLLIQ